MSGYSVLTKRKKPENDEALEGSNAKKRKSEAVSEEKEAANGKEIKLTKKQRKRLERGEGTKEELLQYYGPDATASFELKLKEYFVNGRQSLKVQDIQSLILWVVGETVAPKWFFIKNKPLVNKLVLVLVDGLTMPIFQANKASLPSLKQLYNAHHTAVPLQINSSIYQPCATLEGYFQCSRTKANGMKQKQKQREKEKQQQKSSGEKNASVAEEHNASVEGEGEGAEEKKETEEADGDFRPKAEYYVMTLEELRANSYPLDDEGYEETRPPKKPRNGKEPRMVALDCEMVITEQGFELARMTLVAQDGTCLYDEVIKPERPITDYNTRFSGIDEEKMKSVTKTIADARKAFHKYVDADTILVGHSMENDLHSLGIIHKRIIDTSLLYPHPRGPPAKRALRMLAKDFLGRTIQAGDNGHDSLEDALAALDLVKLKIDKGPEFGIGPSATDNIFRLLSRARKSVYLIGAPDIAQRLAAGNVNAIPCATDAQAIDKACSVVGKETDFVVVHLGGLLHAMTADVNASGEEAKSSSASAYLSSLDGYLRRLHEACPKNSIVAVVSGQPFTGRLRA